MAEVEKIIRWLNSQGETRFRARRMALAGGAAYDKYQVAISDEDMQKALAADAVLFGAVGWSEVGQRSI